MIFQLKVVDNMKQIKRISLKFDENEDTSNKPFIKMMNQLRHL